MKEILTPAEVSYWEASQKYPPEYHRLDEYGVEMELGPEVMKILRSRREGIESETAVTQLLAARYLDDLRKKQESKKRKKAKVS